MKKVLFTLFLTSCFSLSGIAQQDIIYLIDSSIIYGNVLSYSPGENVQIETDCCGIITIEMDKIDRIEKENVTAPKEDIHTPAPIENEQKDNEAKIDLEKEEKKERRKEWMSTIVNKTAEILLAPPKEQSSGELDPQEGNTGTESENPNQEVAGTGNTQNGNICFENPNFYSRRIKITHNISNQGYESILQSKTEGCLYDLPIGTYAFEVYTTFSNKLIYKAQIQITENQTSKIKISEDHLN